MKIVLAYTIPMDQWPTYGESAKRFAKSYREFPGKAEHELLVVCCNGGINEAVGELFAGLPAKFATYFGEGWDCGAAQEAAKRVDCDFLVWTNAGVHFYRAGWLRRFVECRERHGDGLYGASASYESLPYVAGKINPHLRTSFYGCNPVIFREYPFAIRSREDCFKFECGEWNFTSWFHQRKMQARLVTWDGCYERQDFRRAANIFRRGDQSNLILRDRHTDLFAQADAAQRAELESKADGGLPALASCIKLPFDAGAGSDRSRGSGHGGKRAPVLTVAERAAKASEPGAGAARGPLVSVGMPIFNGGRFLAQSVEAILAQDYGNFELVISDNCSTDGSEQICRDFARRDSRIRYIRQAENQGMPWNFAQVVKQARGDFFMWAAHDDLFHPTYIRKCMERLAAHPGAVFCCTEINFIDADGLPHREWSRKGYSNIETLGMTRRERVHELIRRAGWFATYGLMRLADAKTMSLGINVYGYDVILMEELLLLGDFVKVHEPLFSYRIVGSKSAEEYQADFNPANNAMAATKTPYTELAVNLLGTVYRSEIPNAEKMEIFADFIGTLTRVNHWWREQVTAELAGKSAALSDSEFALLLAIALSRSVPLDALRENRLMQAMRSPSSSGELLEIADGMLSEASGNMPNRNARYEAARLFQEGKFEEASKFFKEALHEGESSELLCDWATARLACNQQEDAERGFRAALALQDENHTAALKLGILLASQGRDEEAAELLERCSTQAPESERAEVRELLLRCRAKVVR